MKPIIYFDNLTPEVRRLLLETYKIDDLDVEDVFTDTQLSKIEHRGNYLYVSLQFPQFNKQERQFEVKEVHCFVGHNFFIAINKNNFKDLNQFISYQDELAANYKTTFGLFYEMVDIFVTSLFRAIGKFKTEISTLEKNIFNFALKDDLVTEILILKRNIINFESCVNPLLEAVYELETKYKALIGDEGAERLDDTLDKLKKLQNNVLNFREQMTLLSESNDAQISRSTNQILKALTSISLIAVAPTFLAAFFGMNLYFGWPAESTSYYPLVFVVCTMFVSVVFMIWYFKKRNWI